ncbi:endonuclease IV, partial [Candidatus Woesearchaeota archaeon]|nr:endonuclease IV [Candidatus Woesearchaeota archaeon]
YSAVKDAVIEMQGIIKKKRWKVKLAPETTGKLSQFGTVDELMKLRKETRCSICFDFSHLYARGQGRIDYDSVFKKLKPIRALHCHFSGIEYGERGERKHKNVEKVHFMPLSKALKKYKKDAVIICESPSPYKDAVKMKKWFKGR